LARFGLLLFCGGSIGLRPRIRLLASRLSTASAIPVAVAISVAWRGAPLSGTATILTLSSTAATTVAALVSAAATGARFATWRPLPLSALCRADECSRREDDHCCDEKSLDAHTL